MQAYIDRDDAELERESLTAEGMTGIDLTVFWPQSGRFVLVALATSLLVLIVVALLGANHLGSIPFVHTQPPEVLLAVTTNFTLEEIEPEPVKPIIRPKPKPKPEPEEPRVTERLRSVPDRTTQERRPQPQVRSRSEVVDVERSIQPEAAISRSAPVANTPMIAAPSQAERRNMLAEGKSRDVSRAEILSSKGEARAELPAGETRTVTEPGLSRIALDPYHYRMVNICLRQCVRSIFSHTGLEKQEEQDSKEWLTVSRSAGYFDFRFQGRWVRFQVDVTALGDITTIDFISLPAQWSTGEATESLLETATRNLCRLLQYDDCLTKL